MTDFLAKTGLAALIALGTLAGTAGFAAADTLRGSELRLEATPVQYYGGRDRRGCSPRFAEEAARDYGLRRTRVVDVTPRRVVVEGWRRGGWDRVVFANVRGCPLLRG